MAENDTDLFVATDSANFDYKGQPIWISSGTVVRAGHPILKGREHLFKPLKVHFDVEKPAAKPEKPVPTPAVVASARADQQHARAR